MVSSAESCMRVPCNGHDTCRTAVRQARRALVNDEHQWSFDLRTSSISVSHPVGGVALGTATAAADDERAKARVAKAARLYMAAEGDEERRNWVKSGWF